MQLPSFCLAFYLYPSAGIAFRKSGTKLLCLLLSWCFRLEKGPSLLDIRLECQDLERFSIINRFGRFHGRGPAEGATTADSSAAGPAAPPSLLDVGSLVPKMLSPQRYVTAVPVPKSLLEGLQCHSL